MAGFPATIDLGSLSPDQGFVITGTERAVTVSGGDINNDGFDDILLGGAGSTAWAVFGGASLAGPISLAGLDGTNGFTLTGATTGSWHSIGVAGLGDVNDDGVEDFGLTARYGRGHGPRSDVFVLYGSSDAAPASIDVSGLGGTDGFVLHGVPQSDANHPSPIASITRLGDANGDGIDDFLVGAVGRSHWGAGYVVFGTTSGMPDHLDLKSLNGTNGYRIDGSGAFYAGAGSTGGDFNGDGLADMVLGSRTHGAGSTGFVSVVFGSSGPHAATFGTRGMNEGDGFIVQGSPGDRIGPVVSAGDFNGDGIDDLLMGARHGGYVLFGDTDGFATSISLAALDASRGVHFTGLHHSKVSAVNAGDFNGDGIDDVLLVASTGAYLVFGSHSHDALDIDLGNLDGSNGIHFLLPTVAFPSQPPSASIAADVNGDGFDDLVIAGGGFDTYVVYGHAAEAASASVTMDPFG